MNMFCLSHNELQLRNEQRVTTVVHVTQHARDTNDLIGNAHIKEQQS